MSKKTVDQRIVEKRKRLNGIHDAMAIYMATKLTYEKNAKVKELEDRLEYRISLYEEKLLDEKIELYSQALKALKA